MTAPSQRIQDIKSRAEKATEGPWRAVDKTTGNHTVKILGSHDYLRVGTINAGLLQDANADFIAHARTDIPWLLSQLDASLARERALREALRELLMHAGIADAAAEDIDAEDHARERNARALLKKD